jgi:hypothetical protein
LRCCTSRAGAIDAAPCRRRCGVRDEGCCRDDYFPNSAHVGGGILNDSSTVKFLHDQSLVSGNTADGSPSNCTGTSTYDPTLPDTFCASV